MTSVDDALLNPIRPTEDKQEVEVLDGSAEEGRDRINEDKVEGTVEEPICGECKVETGGRADVDEDARKPKPAARPYTPTKEEVREHEVTHLPYRTWCKHCVFGKGVSAPHMKSDGKGKIGITISMDYCFMVDEEKEDDLPEVLVMWDDNYE